MSNEKEPLQQDLEQADENMGRVFVIHLLMEEQCKMPDKEQIKEVLERHLGNIDCFSYDDAMAGFSVKDHVVEYEDGSAPAMLMLSKCFEIEKPLFNALESSQLWDCPDSEAILSRCKFHVIANDMLAGGMEYAERAEMLVGYIEALAELFPSCEAFIFDNSKKMITREAVLECSAPMNTRFIRYAVNVRFFNIQGTDDHLIDTVGMSTLYLPDLQYHFHGVEPNTVVNHAYNVLSYIYDSGNPIKSGDTIDGLKNGKMCIDVQWKTQYEQSLIQPVREVIDINMNEFASGKR